MLPGPSTVPDVDYSKTAHRSDWSEVHEEVIDALGATLGTSVIGGDAPSRSGFGSHYAGRVHLADGRSIFVKAAPQELDHAFAMIAVEADLLSCLPSGMPLAPLLAHVEVGGWRALAIRHISGRMPEPSWCATDLDLIYDACSAVSSACSRVPDGLQVQTWEQTFLKDPGLMTTATALIDGRFALSRPNAALGDLIEQYGGALGAAFLDAPHFAADTLTHNDLRFDNVLIASDDLDGGPRAYILDWTQVASGPAYLDFLGLLPMAARQGVEIWSYLERPMFASATDAHIESYLSAIAIYMLAHLGKPPPGGASAALPAHRLLFAYDYTAMFGQFRDRHR